MQSLSTCKVSNEDATDTSINNFAVVIRSHSVITVMLQAICAQHHGIAHKRLLSINYTGCSIFSLNISLPDISSWPYN